MAKLGMTINPDETPPDDREFDVIPAGVQALAHITESEVKPTNAGDGTIVVFRWDILDGPYKGRVVWDNCNIVNPNPQAQEIGQRHFSSICVATGVGATDDTEPLHFKPCMVKIGVQPAKGQYEAKNVIKGVKAVGSMQPANVGVQHGQAKSPATRPAAAPAPANGTARPWGAKAAGGAPF